MNRHQNTDHHSSLQDLEGTDENKLEYIKGMISLVREDMKIVMLYVSLSIGIIILFLTQIPFEIILSLCLPARILVFIGIALFTIAALFFFLYIRNLHITQMRMTRCLASLNTLHTRELWAGESGVWKIHGFKYVLAKWFLGGGLVSFGTVLFYILILKK